MAKEQLDPILRSVLANRFESVCSEMGETMMRTSHSPIFSEARDFVTGIFDAKGNMIAQRPYIAVLAGALPFCIKTILEYFGDDIEDGDIILTNDPYLGGNNHLPDFTVARPIFSGDEIVFWAAAKGHMADTGATGCCGYNPEADSIWQEGLRIPPSKLYKAGRYNRSVWNLILKNVRMQSLVEGDLNCLVGATKVGERKMLRGMKVNGLQTLLQAVEEINDATEKHMREEIRKIPDGEYTAERYMDHNGFDRNTMVKVKVTIKVKGDNIIFDFTGSDPQVRGSINSTEANTFSSVCLAIFLTVDPDIRKNGGSMRPIQMIAPKGSVVNCAEPAACTSCTICDTATIVEAIWLALSQAVPEKTQAAWARWSAPATMGFNPRTGRLFGDIHFMSKGGSGATLGFDGWDHLGVISCAGGLRSPDPELHELVCPYTIQEYEYLPDSAGAGKWRGGMGVTYRWRIEADNILSDNFGDGLRPETGPFGIVGGKGPKPSKLRVIRPDGSVENPDVHKFVTLNNGDVYDIKMAGGGGYGNPFERDITKVHNDVLDELVSIRSAREDYGVVIDPASLTVDMAATQALRKGD
jgi:N-methylhydantoinase B